MANETKLKTSSELYIGQWSNPDAPAPKLASPIDTDDTILSVTAPLKNSAGTVVTGGFLMGIKKTNGWTETIWVPAGAVSVDGLTIGTSLIPVVRGVKPNGYDFTVGSSDFADSHDADEPVFCNIPAIIPELIRSVLQGLIASGGSDFIIGVDAAGTVTVKRSTGTGTSVGFMRWYTTTGKTQYSNNGTDWVNIDDTVASVLFKVSATDTTPGYALTKIVAGSNITITQTGTGGNETLVISTSLPEQITEPSTYTPGYLTGGGSAESSVAAWDSVTDGSFRVTINGTARNIDGIDFTSCVGGDMDDVAAVIQAAIRAATGSTETCVWSTDHFVITSASTASTSAISVLTTSTGTVGTDISGAGASDWMDADTGNGVATAAVLDQTADEGKVALLDSTGKFNNQLVPIPSVITADAGELNKLDGASANVTAANLNTLTGGGATTLHTHNSQAGGVVKYAMSAIPASFDFAHGLGVAPTWVKVTAIHDKVLAAAAVTQSVGYYKGAAYSTFYIAWTSANPPAFSSIQQSTAVGISYMEWANSGSTDDIQYQMTVSAIDATNVSFAISRTLGGGAAGNIIWIIECGF